MLRQSPKGRDGSRVESGLDPVGPSFMAPPQLDQHSPANHTLRSPKTPSPLRSQNSHARWTADFLKDLRSNRPERPGGARPNPVHYKKSGGLKASPVPERAASAMGVRNSPVDKKDDVPEISTKSFSHRRTRSNMGPRDPTGRPVAKPVLTREVSTPTAETTSSPSSHASTSQQFTIPYYERGQRWMERQEMSSLRQALEDKDLNEEILIHRLAQNEASDLVWKHQNPDVPDRKPDRPDYKQHLRKGSHTKSQCVGPFETLHITKGGSSVGSRSASDGSSSNQTGRSVSSGSQKSGRSTSSRKSYSSLSFSMRSRKFFQRKNSQRGRYISSGSGTTIIPCPENKIYEEPSDVIVTLQESARPLPLKPKARNTSYGSYEIISKVEKNNRTQTASLEKTKTVSIVDIYKNAPSRSRDGYYCCNPDPTPASESIDPASECPSSINGKELRSDDIRAATSMRFKDRSPKLPMPSVVSDRPGRPIVSFEKDWRPRQKELRHETFSSIPSPEATENALPQMEGPCTPQATCSAPPVPIINLPDEIAETRAAEMAIPVISVSETPTSSATPNLPSTSVSCEAPTICVSEAAPLIAFSSQDSSSRPLPQPARHSKLLGRPLPIQGSATPIKSAPHWSPAPLRTQAQCAACALPISGRIVSAAAQRFHPHCFTCYQCGELLECVAFYPEPEAQWSERLARIQARLNNEVIPTGQAHLTESDDGDESLRFYCHLDFHERFSPRCRSCKTPIEGEVILACGGEWHVGHFFCAECGDPFEKDMPFVEKDGFAWCVACHTRRYSGRCAGCKKPVTDMVINALGKEWHETCFCCKVSRDPQFLCSN